MRQSNFAAPANCDQFGYNRDCNLLGGNCGDIKTYRRKDSLEILCRNAVCFQLLENRQHLAAGTDHADVLCLRINGPAKYVHIVAMTAGNNDSVAAVAGQQTRHNFFHITRMNLICFWKALAVGIKLAIIRNDGFKTGQRCHFI